MSEGRTRDDLLNTTEIEDIARGVPISKIASPIHSVERTSGVTFLELFDRVHHATDKYGIQLVEGTILDPECLEEIFDALPKDADAVTYSVVQITRREGLIPPESAEAALDMYTEWLRDEENTEYIKALGNTTGNTRQNVYRRFMARREVGTQLYLSWLRELRAANRLSPDTYQVTEDEIMDRHDILTAVERELIAAPEPQATEGTMARNAAVWDLATQRILDDPTRTFLFEARKIMPQHPDFQLEFEKAANGIVAQAIAHETLASHPILTRNGWETRSPVKTRDDVHYGIDLTIADGETGRVVCDVSVKSMDRPYAFAMIPNGPQVLIDFGNADRAWEAVEIQDMTTWKIKKGVLLNVRDRGHCVIALGVPRGMGYNYAQHTEAYMAELDHALNQLEKQVREDNNE